MILWHSRPRLCLFFLNLIESEIMINIRSAALLGWFVLPLSLAFAQSPDPCSANGLANAERRLCYSNALTRLNADVELVVKDSIGQFRRDAADFQSQSPVVADELLKAAAAMMRSQRLWKKYREQHCEGSRT